MLLMSHKALSPISKQNCNKYLLINLMKTNQMIVKHECECFKMSKTRLWASDSEPMWSQDWLTERTDLSFFPANYLAPFLALRRNLNGM